MTKTNIVLHIDDDHAILELVQKHLSKNGIEVVSLQDPEQALQTLVACGARVVLLDVEMGKTNGLELLKQIKAEDGGVQVIMMTGVVRQSMVLNAMRWGASDCLFKPIHDPVGLLRAVGEAFAKLDRWRAVLKELGERRALND